MYTHALCTDMCVDMFVAKCTDMAFTQELAGDAAVAGFDVGVQVRVILGARAPHGDLRHSAGTSAANAALL